MKTNLLRKPVFLIVMTALVSLPLLWTPPADARGRGHRGGAHRSVNRAHHGHANRNVNHNRNRNVNHNRNRNVNINKNVDIDVDHRGGYHGYRYHDYHPIAAAAVAAVVVGTIVHSLPPSCSAVVVNGITYQQCGNSWYQPQYSGSSVSYVVVNQP